MTSFLNGKPVPNPPSVTLPLPPLTAKIETENANSSRANAKQKASTNNIDIAETGGNTRNPLSSEKMQQANGVHTKQKSAMPSSPDSSASSVTSTSIADASKGDLAEQKQRPNHRANNSSPNVVVEPSADDPDYIPPQSATGGAKKGKKKKKKSAMANAANPHHVKNCK
ncbi:hypothetical protein QFC19_002275 [Naganishia cerealis]|uniref:Uncharacterized protein n=1 Tax=Naganishia cerealis TaxID=610337 RepID=A0ACC2WBE9_9TREE|nr:hypothetical protein QFC19_002275 [Naganishia cerealis]